MNNPSMQTFLSFEPRYHELTCRDGQPMWVPMYNPIREVVQVEAQRIKGEFGKVDSTAWVRPARKKIGIIEVWADVADLAKFLAGAMLLGWLMSCIPLIDQLLTQAPADNRVPATMAMGGATLSLCGLVVALVRLRRSRQRAAAEQHPDEA
jgi:hypothetical protein